MIKIKVTAAFRCDKPVMLVLRAILCLVTVLSLALSGAALVARTVHGPIIELVICGDAGAKTIYLDAQSNPIESGQCCDCPQCLTLAATSAVKRADTAVSASLVPAESPAPFTGHLPDAARHARAMPRGPPADTSTASEMRPQPGLLPTASEFGQVRRGVAMAVDGQPTRVTR